MDDTAHEYGELDVCKSVRNNNIFTTSWKDNYEIAEEEDSAPARHLADRNAKHVACTSSHAASRCQQRLHCQEGTALSGRPRPANLAPPSENKQEEEEMSALRDWISPWLGDDMLEDGNKKSKEEFKEDLMKEDGETQTTQEKEVLESQDHVDDKHPAVKREEFHRLPHEEVPQPHDFSAEFLDKL